MKIFIWGRLAFVSEEYHPGGGLVVIARDAAHVNELIKSKPEIIITDLEWENVSVYPLEGDVEPRMWVMVDAGCC